METFKEDVKLAVKGDCNAFARLYSAVYKDLYRIALCSLRSSQDAQDAVSETVLDAYASVKNLRDIGAFKSWIIKILSSKIQRKQSEYYKMPQLCVEEDDIQTQTDIYSVEITEAISKLSDDEKLVISLSAVGGYKSKEIAKLCRLKDSTVRSRLMRAREKLENELFPTERNRI